MIVRLMIDVCFELNCNNILILDWRYSFELIIFFSLYVSNFHWNENQNDYKVFPLIFHVFSCFSIWLSYIERKIIKNIGIYREFFCTYKYDDELTGLLFFHCTVFTSHMTIHITHQSVKKVSRNWYLTMIEKGCYLSFPHCFCS